ncbi:NAD(P)-binding protein [Pseudorhodoferax sp.]|uniref:NAD(P)-binding protein n=1 Tax=Pseudorhodoferax sp. TaxID=1993553 RepID=UPI002DD6A590|nr:NAD(P)-binding protein [Pseudorhodoferax sp.]
MDQSLLETDYLVVGAGATGLAFADTLLAETADAHITIVDRHGKPGGHWNDAYPFVTLHQPSAFYGVNSLELGSGRKDTIGLNQGLYELASGAEVSGYFDRVMQHRLLPSGRVRYLPLSNHLGEGRVESLLSGARTQVVVRRKLVDANYHSPSVPATHAPRFACADGVRLVPPNALAGLWHSAQRLPLPRRFVVIGAGKTATDTCVWLLQTGAHPDAITWIVPRDAWLTNRLTTQTGPEFFFEAIGNQADQMEACAQASSADDLFLRLEACGNLLRIDPDRMPAMFHFATVSAAEVALLRGIHQVVRLGHVQALEPARVVLEQGELPVAPDTLFIDCTASALTHRPPQPIFQDGRIVLQVVRMPLPTFSAAITGWVEAHGADDAHKNRLLAPVPFPRTPADYPRTVLANMQNQFQWGQDKALREWMRASRLDGFGKLMASAGRDEADKQAVLARYKAAAVAAMANLPRLMPSAPPPPP